MAETVRRQLSRFAPFPSALVWAGLLYVTYFTMVRGFGLYEDDFKKISLNGKILLT